VRPWSKPVVFLVDDRTRSAKELLSWHIRDESLGPLVGEKTEGAVLGAHFVPLPGGHWLELGAQEVPVNGVTLEGVGVEPTHPSVTSPRSPTASTRSWSRPHARRHPPSPPPI
jgi:C-terminal processing protease CtpA/Prc